MLDTVLLWVVHQKVPLSEGYAGLPAETRRAFDDSPDPLAPFKPGRATFDHGRFSNPQLRPLA